MIKSFFGLSISDTTSSSSTATSSSTTSENGEVKDENKSNSSSIIQADESSDITSKKPLSAATGSQLVTTKISEPLVIQSDPSTIDAEGEDDEIDEESMKEAVQSYADEERLAPFRTKQILKKVLKPLPPNEPDPSVSRLIPLSGSNPHQIHLNSHERIKATRRKKKHILIELCLM